jgi:formamidopyrimidine-DNA glycosylase
MPELPEVEVTRLSVAPGLEGAVIEHVWLGLSLRFDLGCAPERLQGQRIAAVTRRGKYLLLHTQSGVLILHLGMSGSLRWLPIEQGKEQGKHRTPWVRFELQCDKGTLQLDDPRRFGAAVWCEGHEPHQHALLAKLGPEPLEPGFDGAILFNASRKRQVSIKQWLLAGQAVVGVGNIYASEALFRARIHPAMTAGRLSKPRAQLLANAVREVLAQAIARGGSTLRDFSNAHGEAGLFQLDANVYDREGQPCTVCATAVRRITQGQRSTYFCVSCQKR